MAALADAAWWLGLTDESLTISSELYLLHLRERRTGQAARLLTAEVERAMANGELEQAAELARQVQSIADLFGDTTLGAMGLVAEGIALVKMGRVLDGMALLDEAMLPVRAGEVEPAFAGNLYCQLMWDRVATTS